MGAGLLNEEVKEFYPEAGLLLEKWNSHIDAVNEAFGEDVSLDRKVVLASCLEQTQNHLIRAEHLFETTQPTDIGPFKKFGLELLTAVVPNLIAFDIVSVQPMDNKVGEIRYIKYLYGSNKGTVRRGDEITSALEFTGGNFNYSSETVDEEFVGDAGAVNYTGNLSYTPVRPGTVVFNVNGNDYVDDGQGNIDGPGLDVAGNNEINYSSGEFDFLLANAAGEDVTVSYEFNLEHVPSTIPQVDTKIDIMPIIARSRKLRATYSFDAAYDMMKDYGTEINTALVGEIANEIKHEIDGEILSDLLNIAPLTIDPFSKTPPAGISQQDHYNAFYHRIIEGSNQIFSATRRAAANFIVAGISACDVIEAMDRFERSGIVNPVGPHLAGELNGIPVYKNPYYPNDTYLAGYRGEGLFDSGFVYAPYMPIMTTSLIMMDDFVGRKGFATSYGKKTVNNRLYARGTVTP